MNFFPQSLCLRSGDANLLKDLLLRSFGLYTLILHDYNILFRLIQNFSLVFPMIFICTIVRCCSIRVLSRLFTLAVSGAGSCQRHRLPHQLFLIRVMVALHMNHLFGLLLNLCDFFSVAFFSCIHLHLEFLLHFILLKFNLTQFCRHFLH